MFLIENAVFKCIRINVDIALDTASRRTRVTSSEGGEKSFNVSSRHFFASSTHNETYKAHSDMIKTGRSFIFVKMS